MELAFEVTPTQLSGSQKVISVNKLTIIYDAASIAAVGQPLAEIP